LAASYLLDDLSDQALLRNVALLVARERTLSAILLAHLAEVDARKLYVPAGYSSMYAYCIHELRLSEDAAYKRIQAARAARRFPALFATMAEGRLHLAAVCLLAPHLTPENAESLMTAATHQRKADIEELLAQRFPRQEIETRVESLAPPPALPLPSGRRMVAAPEAQRHPRPADPSVSAGASGRGGDVAELAPGQAATAQARIEPVPGQAPPPRLTPLAPERFALQVTIDQATRDKLRYAQALLGHQVQSRDVAQVLDRALDALIRQLEKSKFAATDRPRAGQAQPAPGSRHVPAHVQRAVWERDGGRCTFVNSAGQRCPSRTMLEFDHVDEVARGGQSTVEGIRLRCRAHNQYGAECTFGKEFMNRKREETTRAMAGPAPGDGQVSTDRGS
jgi:5-methylcytosine-specific restriction endonuclease McrA